MLLRMRLFLSSIVGTFVLLLMLCLGSQNLSERSVVNLGIGKTVPLPQGFVVGLAILCGVLSGGTSAALLAPHQDE
ncbi:MAG: hypothetical protein EBR69_04355 [Synechococcaceae bacterium WB4_2_0805]|nr:hypothetical protein [Synechococcaceae bacterium WB4_2_0805]